jgi:hypothetical protein
MTGETVTTGVEGSPAGSYRALGVYQIAGGAHETNARCGNRR